MKLFNYLHFSTKKIYNIIINFYYYNKNPIFIYSNSNIEANFLCKKISCWLLCFNKKNINCNLCKGCILFEINNNPDYFYYNLDYNFNDNKLLINLINFIKYKKLYINKVIYISNIEFLNKKIMFFLTKIIDKYKSSIYFIFSCSNYRYINNNILYRCFFYNINIYNKFLINYVKNKYKLKINKNIIYYIYKLSIFNNIDLINENILYNIFIFLKYIKLSLINKNFIYFINLFNKEKLELILVIELILDFLLDLIKFNNNFNIKKININIIKLIINNKIDNLLLFDIFEKFSTYKNLIYSNNLCIESNNKIIFIYNILLLNKIF